MSNYFPAGNVENKVVSFTVVPPKVDLIGIHRIIKENIRTTDEINAVGVTGTVEIKFRIEEDGTLTDFEVIKSLTPETDAEALRVAKLLPKREPIVQQLNGPDVIKRSSTIPITFPYQSPFER